MAGFGGFLGGLGQAVQGFNAQQATDLQRQQALQALTIQRLQAQQAQQQYQDQQRAAAGLVDVYSQNPSSAGGGPNVAAGGLPGAQPIPAAPQPPMPGQASVPRQPVAGAAAAPPGGAPMAPGPAGQPPQAAAGAAPQGGMPDLTDPHTFVVAYKKARPDATPGEVLEALDKSEHIIDPQKKLELESTKIQLGAMQKILDVQERYFAANQRSQTAITIQGMRDTSADRRAALAQGAPLTPDDKASLGAQAATGEPLNQISSGYGKQSSAVRTAARQGAIENIMSELHVGAGQAGQELARRQAMYQADKASTTQLDKMLGATRQAVAQLTYNVDQAKKEMAKLPSTNLSPVLNAIARGEQKWTGNPAYSGLFFAMQAVATESARILSGGQASVAQLAEGAREEAQKWANINMTPAQFDEVARQIEGEGQARLDTYQSAISEQQPGRGAQPAQATSQSVPKAGEVQDGYRFKGGDPADPNNWEKAGG